LTCVIRSTVSSIMGRREYRKGKTDRSTLRVHLFFFFCRNREINLAIFRFLSSFLSENFYLYFVGIYLIFFLFLIFIFLYIVLMTLQCNDYLIVQFDPINLTNWTYSLLNSTYVWNTFKYSEPPKPSYRLNDLQKGPTPCWHHFALSKDSCLGAVNCHNIPKDLESLQKGSETSRKALRPLEGLKRPPEGLLRLWCARLKAPPF
jgi:hypothetical protein